MTNINIFLTLISVFTLFSAFGQTKILDRDDIARFAEAEVKKQITVPINGKISITANPIDPRIKIKSCHNPLTANIPEKTTRRNVNVKISCTDSTPWHIYIIVKVSVSIPIVVTITPISKGAILDDSNIALIYRDKAKIRGILFTDTTEVYGSKSKKKLSQGYALTRKDICMVCKGERVTIIARTAHLTIKTAGIALSNGNLGDQIRVKNRDSGKIVTAQVNAINRVVINL